jgi:hypothetical protein
MPHEALSPLHLHALAAELSRKLGGFAAWFVEWCVWLPFHAALKRRAYAKLRLGARAFQRIVFLLAVYRAAPPLKLKRMQRPPNAPPGFRLHLRKRGRRLMHISGLHQGGLRQRIARLKRLIENIEACIAHMAKRLAACEHVGCLAIAYAIAVRLVARDAAPAAAHVDSS